MKISEKKKLINITRFDQEPIKNRRKGSHGWWVRFMRNKIKYSEFFGDDKNGGREKAKEAAIRFRDAFSLQLSESPSKEYSRSGKRKLNTRNKTGVEGVYHTTYPTYKRGKQYVADLFVAHWPSTIPEKLFEMKSFSIKKYGKAEAFRLAVEARKAGVKLLVPPRHKAFTTPENPDTKIWRYMDFTKFVSMLDTKALFFSRIDTLDDPFEGSFSRANEELRPLVYKGNPETSIAVSKLIKELRKWVVVNCWHVSEYESAAMWELYSKSNEAICIQSTWQKLSSSLNDCAEIGSVQYVDYEKEWVPEHEPLLPFLYKRRSFEHEKEIRAIKNTGDLSSFDGVQLAGDPPEDGTHLFVDLSLLIETIFVSPRAPEWFYVLVKKIARKYGLAAEVKQSSLMADPFY